MGPSTLQHKSDNTMVDRAAEFEEFATSSDSEDDSSYVPSSTGTEIEEESNYSASSVSDDEDDEYEEAPPDEDDSASSDSDTSSLASNKSRGEVASSPTGHGVLTGWGKSDAFGGDFADFYSSAWP